MATEEQVTIQAEQIPAGWIKEGEEYHPQAEVTIESAGPTTGFIAEDNEYTEKRRNSASDALTGAAIGAASKVTNPVVSNVLGKVIGRTPAGAAPIPIGKVDPRYSAVENWAKQMFKGNYAGGEHYKDAHRLGIEAAEKAKKAEQLQKLNELFMTDKEVKAARSATAAGPKHANPLARIISNVDEAVKGATPKGGNLLNQGLGLGLEGLARVAAGANAGFQASDAYNRYLKNDIPGAVISGLGALGSGASLIPTPVTRVVGTGMGLSADAINYLRDHPELLEKYLPFLSGEKKAVGGLVSFADGGSVMPTENGPAIPPAPQQYDPYEQPYSTDAMFKAPLANQGVLGQDGVAAVDPSILKLFQPQQ